MRKRLIMVGLLVILATMGMMVVEKESTLRDGAQVFLELAPADPRSLMQGDYMALEYAVNNGLIAAREETSTQTMQGVAILTLDERRVGRFTRLDDGSALGESDVRIAYKLRNFRTQVGSPSFFFQEGTAGLFENARFGEYRLTEDGTSVLIGLRDAELNVLGPEQRLH